MNRQFHPGELSGADGGEPTSAELSEATLAARALESRLSASDVHPSADFVDRVMTAVAVEPRPQPAVAAGLAMRHGRFGAMVAALTDSWRVAFSGGRPLAVRAQALAFVLVAILAIGSLGGMAAVGAVRLLGPAPDQTLERPSVAPTAPPSESRPQPTPTPALTTPSPEPTDDAEATETPEPSETEDPSNTPRATKTPRPTRTPHDTPEPTETEDAGEDGGHGEGEDSTPEP